MDSMRILVVEDHRDSLDAMSRILARESHSVAGARTLEEAMRQCINGKFDLVLCDIGLPDGEGWEMATVARECGCSAIAMTGCGMADEVAKARDAGFADHLLKPFMVDDLLAAIARIVPGDSHSISAESPPLSDA